MASFMRHLPYHVIAHMRTRDFSRESVMLGTFVEAQSLNTFTRELMVPLGLTSEVEPATTFDLRMAAAYFIKLFPLIEFDHTRREVELELRAMEMLTAQGLFGGYENTLDCTFSDDYLLTEPIQPGSPGYDEAAAIVEEVFGIPSPPRTSGSSTGNLNNLAEIPGVETKTFAPGITRYGNENTGLIVVDSDASVESLNDFFTKLFGDDDAREILEVIPEVFEATEESCEDSEEGYICDCWVCRRGRGEI